MTLQAPLQPGEVRTVSPDDFPTAVRELSNDLNPLKDGILMAHQKAWIADDADLKLAEKGRRTGITWAEAQGDTLIAASARSAGGDNIYYIGDTKEKGLEFIGYCAHFLKFIDGKAAVEEYLHEFREVGDDGKEVIDRIAAYRIRCASGYQIVALASRPVVIRGLQGIVVIDEAAFHNDVRGVIDACNALLIWGGKIRLISTHNGTLNAFNELIKETHEGKWPYSIHRITFDDAVNNGLYERVCLVRGWEASEDGKKEWYDRVRSSYGTRKDAEAEELDAIPREGEGTLLPLTLIEAAMTRDYVVKRWEAPASDFVDWPEKLRREDMADWLAEHVFPELKKLPENRVHCFGEDFAMRKDRTSIAVGYVGQTLVRHVPLIVELKACPYDQQKQALFYIVSRLPRFNTGILDANGNGMAIAQEARQKYGSDRIIELTASDGWYREFTPRFAAAFEDKSLLIPADTDVRDDLKQFQMIRGVGKIPNNIRTDGTDGGKRHADSAIALLNFYTATQSDVIEYDYRAVKDLEQSVNTTSPNRMTMRPTHDDDGPRGSGGWNKGAW